MLEGTDGVEKMSKSLGNYIGITEPAPDIYGKVMSISDPLMWRYWELLTTCHSRISRRSGRTSVPVHLHPMKAKGDLAARIVSDFHGPEAAREAAEQFARVHQRGEVPEDMPIFEVQRGDGVPPLVDVLVAAGLAPSKTEARRLMKAGAVSLDGRKVTEVTAPVPADPDQFVLRCGKLRFCQVRITSK